MKKTIFIILILLISCNSKEKERNINKDVIKNNEVKMDNRINLTKDAFENKSIDDIFYLIGDEVYNRYIDLDKINEFENPLKNLILIFNMHGQVENGGVSQFVDNSTGDYFDETLIALKDIGIDEYVDILETVKQTFPNNKVPKDIIIRRNVIDNMAKTQEEDMKMVELYEKLDSLYYANDKKFKTKLIEYTKKELFK